MEMMTRTLGRSLEAWWTSKHSQTELEAQFKSSSSLLRSPGAARTKINAQAATESVLDALYMDGKIILRSFQWHWFEAQMHSESTGIVETSECPESVKLLQHHLLGCWPVYRVGVHYGRG